MAIITKKELDILNKMPAAELSDIHEDNGLVLDINDGKITGYSQEQDDYEMER